MRCYVFACCLLSAGMSAHAQGTVGALIYQTARFSGKAVPIYGVDPNDPTYAVRGDNLAFYARREPVLGNGYWAELWAGPQSATEAGLAPVPGSKVHFRDDISAIRGSDNLRLPGTFGGDIVTLQLRVWTTFYDGRDLSSWLDVLVEPGAPRGTSSLTRMTLGNISADGHIFLPELLSFHLEGFGLYIVPEPATCLPLSLGLGLLGLSRLRHEREAPKTPASPCPSLVPPHQP